MKKESFRKTIAEKPSIVEAVEQISTASKSPYVFISHDTRDAELAEEFSNLLSSVSLGILKTFRSSDKKGAAGIEYGTEWYPEIMKKLNQASDIVCLLTENSVNRPWILYEAGVAKGKLNNTKVFGIALGISSESAYSGPFAQFQNCGDDEESLTNLVFALVKRIPNTEPNIDTIKTPVKAFIKKKDEILAKQPGTHKKEDKVESAVVKLFEEVKIMFQDLPSKIENRVDPEKRRHIRLRPHLLREFPHYNNGDQNFYGFLVMISIFKNDLPWIYEIGLETYKELKLAKSANQVQNAMDSFKRVLEFSFETPFASDFVRNEKDYFFVFEEMRFFLKDYTQTVLDSKRHVEALEEKKNKKK